VAAIGVKERKKSQNNAESAEEDLKHGVTEKEKL
jgi:hypothetical protein